MKRLWCAALGAIALLGLAPGHAAEPYPWCFVDQTMSGATTCAFVSYAQCYATAAGGNGGYCIENPAYRGPPAAGARRAPR